MQVQEGNQELIELHKHLSRLPGCSFLGAKATEAYTSINDDTECRYTLLKMRILAFLHTNPTIHLI